MNVELFYIIIQTSMLFDRTNRTKNSHSISVIGRIIASSFFRPINVMVINGYEQTNTYIYIFSYILRGTIWLENPWRLRNFRVERASYHIYIMYICMQKIPNVCLYSSRDDTNTQDYRNPCFRTTQMAIRRKREKEKKRIIFIVTDIHKQ